MSEAGVERSTIYVTNVVKHFRFEERGTKRLHKEPATRHVEACRPWLDVELREVEPRQPGRWNHRLVLPTIHPSYVIRSRDDDVRRQRFGFLVEGLAVAAALAQG